jgi:hypothetical protein
MNDSLVEVPPLFFTAHCQVRYIERFLDQEAVREARREAKSDALILQALMGEFADDLRHFRHVVQVGYYNTIQKAGEFVEGTSYRLNLGPLSVAIDGNVCTTTICKHHPPAPSDPQDDDPMEEQEHIEFSPLAA